MRSRTCSTHGLHGTTDPACLGCQMDAAQQAPDVEVRRLQLAEAQRCAAVHMARAHALGDTRTGQRKRAASGLHRRCLDLSRRAAATQGPLDREALGRLVCSAAHPHAPGIWEKYTDTTWREAWCRVGDAVRAAIQGEAQPPRPEKYGWKTNGTQHSLKLGRFHIELIEEGYSTEEHPNGVFRWQLWIEQQSTIPSRAPARYGLDTGKTSSLIEAYRAGAKALIDIVDGAARAAVSIPE